MINSFIEKIFNSIPETLSILIVLGFSLLALVLAIIITFSLIRVILRIKWKNQTVSKLLRIKNEGNVNERFLVKFIVPESELRYQCLLEGNALQKSEEVQRIIVKAKVEEMDNEKAGSHVVTSTTLSEKEVVQLNSQQSIKDSPDNKEAKKKLDDAASKAKEKSKKGFGLIRLASGILGSLGSILPGSVGGAFKEKANVLQKTSQDASNKMQMPEQKMRSVEQLKSQMGQINSKEKDQKEKGKVPSAVENYPLQTRDGSKITHTQSVPMESRNEYREISLSDYFETPTLKPGEVHHLDLSFDPLHPYQTKEYFIEAFVQQMESKREFFNEEPGNTKAYFNVLIKGLSPIFWILSFLLVLCTVLINSTWAVLFISWLARFVI